MFIRTSLGKSGLEQKQEELFIDHLLQNTTTKQKYINNRKRV